MSAPTVKASALYLPEVEGRHQPGIYHDLIAAARAQGAEYSKIWDLFAFQQSFTIHMARFTQGVLRQPATITPALRELIAASTSYQNECGFCTQAHAAAASELYGDADLVWTALRDLDRAPLDDKTKRLLRFVFHSRFDLLDRSPERPDVGMFIGIAQLQRFQSPAGRLELCGHDRVPKRDVVQAHLSADRVG